MDLKKSLAFLQVKIVSSVILISGKSKHLLSGRHLVVTQLFSLLCDTYNKLVAHWTDTIGWFDFLFKRPKSRNSINHQRLKPVLCERVSGERVQGLWSVLGFSCFEVRGAGWKRVRFDFGGGKSMKRTRSLTGKNQNQAACCSSLHRRLEILVL